MSNYLNFNREMDSKRYWAKQGIAAASVIKREENDVSC